MNDINYYNQSCKEKKEGISDIKPIETDMIFFPPPDDDKINEGKK
jgi:hypothetical protein